MKDVINALIIKELVSVNIADKDTECQVLDNVLK
jgi:hypothetical protein